MVFILKEINIGSFREAFIKKKCNICTSIRVKKIKVECVGSDVLD